jgi:hypothetical protein
MLIIFDPVYNVDFLKAQKFLTTSLHLIMKFKIFKKASSMDQYITHQWTFDNGQMNDQIGSSHMTQGSFTTNFTTDRFGTPNSALALNGGWTQAPSGIYFDSPEFSISVWILPQQVTRWSRIIDFGNGPDKENVVLGLSFESTLKPFFVLNTDDLFANSQLKFGEWQFLVATFDGSIAKLYSNGQIVMNTTSGYTYPITRFNCYIGKSSWDIDRYSNTYLDDLRFYNKSLTGSDVIQLMMGKK